MSQMPAAQLLDPVTPSGAAGVQQTASNLNQAAALSAQMAMAKAHLDVEQKIAKAQIDATASEHGKYQDFLAQQEAVKISAQRDEQNRAFAHDLEVKKQANAFQTKQFDRVKQLELDKSRFDMAHLTAGAAGQEELQKKRAGYSDQILDLETTQAAATAAFGKSRGELEDAVNALNPMVVAQMQSIGALRANGLTSADAAVKAALDKLVLAPEMKETFGEGMTRQAAEGGHGVLGVPFALAKRAVAAVTGQASPEQRIEKESDVKATHITGVLSNEIASSLAMHINSNASGVAPVDPDKVKQLVGLALNIRESSEGKDPNDPGMRAALGAFKSLRDEIVQGDPLRGPEVDFALKGLDQALQAATEGEMRSLLQRKATDQLGEGTKITETQVKATIKALNKYKGIGALPEQAGVKSLNEEGLALTQVKLAKYIKGDEQAMASLPPELQDVANKFYDRIVGHEGLSPFQKQEIARRRLGEATKARGGIEKTLKLLETEVGAQTVRSEMQAKEELLKKMENE